MNQVLSTDADVFYSQPRRLEIEAMAKALFRRPLKKILFVQPPDLDASAFSANLAGNKRYWNYPPYGLLLLARIAIERGCEAKVINLQHQMLSQVSELPESERHFFNYEAFLDEKVRSAIEDFQPDLIAASCMFSLTHASFVNVINRCRAYSESLIVIGGVHVTNAYSDAKTRPAFVADAGAADAIFLREAEVSFDAILKFSNDNYDFPGQVAIRNGGGEFEALPITAQPEESEINWTPAYSLSSPTELSSVGRIGTFESILPEQAKIATVLVNRGCRAFCTFCSVRNFNGKGVRGRAVDSVLEELKILKYEHGISHVMWLDDDLLFDWRKAVKLFNLMVRENLNMTWDTTNGVIAASCTDEVISAAASSGCIGMILGMESGNDEILKRIKKPGTVRHFLRAADVLRKYPEINSRVFVMIGFPNETFAQIKESHEVVMEMGLDWANVNILQPLPNTPIFDEMVAAGLIDPAEMKFEDVSFSLGAAGKLSGRRLGCKDMLASSFDDVFRNHKPDAVPTREQLDDIWAYMNFHANFSRLSQIKDRKKLKIQHKWISSICDSLAPTNAFAKYYRCELETRLEGRARAKSLKDLDKNLDMQPYWHKRFSEFALSPSDFGV